MSPRTRFRLITALGLGVAVALGGSILAYLLYQAAALFTWPVIAIACGFTAIVALILDLATERPAE